MKSVSGLCAACVLAATAPSNGAELQTAQCRLTSAGLPGVSAECGTMLVPENPADPGGQAVELFVARVPSLNPAPREDPLAIIAGGPGQAASDFYLTMSAAFEEVRRDRDIVLLDQRGTGRSTPLTCSQMNAATLELADNEALPGLVEACLAELDGDPRFYTTSVAILDLEDVRQALGVPRWNLYGISYGTRVAQHYLRRFPEHTRALILDGVVPGDAVLGPDVAVQAQRVLDQLLERCAADDACAARFPALGTRLDALLLSLSAGPVTVTLDDPISAEPETRQLSVTDLIAVIRLLSYAPQTAALLPVLIDTAQKGNFAPVTAQSEMITGELEATLSLPMHNAVICTEDAPFFAAEPPPRIEQTYIGTRIIDGLRAVCSRWPTGLLDDDLRTPLRTGQPVLLLSGGADPITPPSYGDRVLANLGNARHLIAPAQGHGLAGVGCVPRLMRAFLEAPDPSSLDAACLAREAPSPFFLDFNGPAP